LDAKYPDTIELPIVRFFDPNSIEWGEYTHSALKSIINSG